MSADSAAVWALTWAKLRPKRGSKYERTESGNGCPPRAGLATSASGAEGSADARAASCADVDRKFSATRPCGSKGIGGCDAFMKLCVSSSGCETRPAKGEPARAGSQPCAGLGNKV